MTPAQRLRIRAEIQAQVRRSRWMRRPGDDVHVEVFEDLGGCIRGPMNAVEHRAQAMRDRWRS